MDSFAFAIAAINCGFQDGQMACVTVNKKNGGKKNKKKNPEVIMLIVKMAARRPAKPKAPPESY